MYDTVYMNRQGGDLRVSNAHDGTSDVMVFAGEPIGAPVVASGTMVMNSQAQVNEALRDYQAGTFGEPWDHKLSDDEWSTWCAERPLY
jgi:quercetin 2,3-dioxygenase